MFIDFGSLIKATDFDQDFVVLDNKLLIAIRDDIPKLVGKTCLDQGTECTGANPDNLLYQIPANSSLTIDVSDIIEDAGFENSLGYYFADENGNPISGAILVENAGLPDGQGDIPPLHVSAADIPLGAKLLGFFIIPDGNDTTDLNNGDQVSFQFIGGKWVAFHDGDQVDSAENEILFSDRRLNPDIDPDGNSDPGDDFETSTGGRDSNWEDVVHDSDKDFNDVQFNVKVCATPVVLLTVDEDDIDTFDDGIPGGSLGTSPDDGNGDGSFTGDPSASTGGPANVSGSLAAFVIPGADEPLTFSFIVESAVRSKLSSLGLSSQGDELSYDVQGGILYGFANAGGTIGQSYDPENGDRLVFQFTLEGDGDFTFELFDQLDHDSPFDDSGDGGPGLADENFDLEDSDPDSDVNAIDFGALIKATDYDGDSVVLDDKLLIRIRDDIPKLIDRAKLVATVDEDDIDTSQSKGTSVDDGTGDGSSTGPNPPENGDSAGFDGPANVSGSLTSLVESGADEPLTFRFIAEGSVRDGLQPIGLRSQGEIISYDLQGNVLIGFVNIGGSIGMSYDPDNGDRQVFKLTLQQNGTYTFELFDQMDHDPPYDTDPEPFPNDPVVPGDTATADQNTDLIDFDDDNTPPGEPRNFDINQINFGAVIEAVDFDGDAVNLDGTFLITIRDNIPSVDLNIVNGDNNVTVDETAGTQNDNTTDPAVAALFNGVQVKGTDPDMAPQYARDGDAVVAATVTPGADEPVSVVYSLEIVDGNGANSGLTTTDGREILLFLESGIIVGRYDKPNDGDTDVNQPGSDDPDPAAFAIRIDSSGHISVAQFVSLFHPDTSSNDEDITFATNKILATVTVTDFDGDQAIDKVDVSREVRFSDNGPTLLSDKVELIVDEDDINTGLPAGSVGTSPNDGTADGSDTGNPPSEVTGPALVTGALNDVVATSGADDPLNFTFLSDSAVRAYLEGIGLESKSELLSYDLNTDGEVVGFVQTGGGGLGFTSFNPQSGDRLIFKLTLNIDGTFEFELHDQLDHDAPFDDSGDGSGLADQNTDLVDSDPDGDVNFIDFGAVIQATDADGDSVTLNGKLQITIRDNVPIAKASPAALIATVKEDGLSTAVDEPPSGSSGNDLSTGNLSGGESTSSDQTTGAAGSLATLFTSGADEPLTFGLNNVTSSLPTLFSKGDAVSYQVTGGNTLTATAAGRTVFTLTVNSDGSWSFDLDDQLDHTAASGDAGLNLRTNAAGSTSTPSIDFSSLIVATDFDGDKVIGAATGSFRIAVENDAPINNAAPVTGAVDEDSLNNFVPATQFGSTGNLDATNVGTVATGSLATLVTVGADEPAAFSLSGTFSGLTSQALASKGAALSYAVSGNTLTGFVNLTGSATVFDAGDRPVFTLTLSGTNNSTYTFTLLDQIDHLGSNLSGSGDDQIKTIDFSSLIVATDKDGDAITVDNGFTITVEDNLPINNAAPVTGAVDEDSLNNFVPATQFGSTGNLDATNVGTVATGSLATLVTVGADEPAAFSLSGTFSGLTSQALASKGAALSYAVSGNTLTGFVNLTGSATVFDAGDRPVFTLTLSGTNNSTYTFTLLDQIDHLGSNLSGSGDDQIKTIDFSSLIVATDKDGDAITVDNGFTITVEDNLPINNAAPVTGAVDEDSLNNFVPATQFGSTGNLDATNVGTVATGSLATLVTVGADEPAAFSLSGTFSGLTSQALASKGAALSYAVSGNTLTGFVNLTGSATVFDAGDRPVFTLTLSGTNNSTYTFTLLDQIDHLGSNLSGSGDDQIKTIDFSSLIVATDKDGDAITVDNGFTITVEDNLPINNAAPVTGAVDEDSLNNFVPATQFGSTGNLDATNVGTVATGSLATLVTVGADEPAAFSLSGTFSGLTSQALASKGAALSYAVSGNTLTGFVNLTGSATVFDAGDRPVFTLTLSGTNNSTYTFTLLDQIDHLGSNLSGSGDDQIKTIDFSSLIVATDKDGDAITVDNGFTITVEDNLPINNAAPVTGAVDEDSLNNFVPATQFGSTGNLDATNVGTVATGSLATLVTVGADEPAAFSLSGTFSGLTSQALASKGAALSYAVSGNTLTGFVNLTGSATVFDAGDRPVFTLTLSGTNNSTYTFTLLDQIDHLGSNLSGSGDDQIKTIDFSSLIVATDKDGDAITVDNGFTITVEDNLPTASSVVVSAPLDDEDQAFGIQNGPGDDGSGTTVSGTLPFSTGADEPVQIAFTNGSGAVQVTATNSLNGAVSPLKVVVVDPVTHEAHQETISYQWTPSAGGGTLTAFSTSYPVLNPVFTLTVNSSGNYTLDLNAPLAHPFTDPDFQNNGPETEIEDNLQLDIAFTVTDRDGDSATSTLTVNVDDDTPDAVGECEEAQEGRLASVNIVLILDTSGSMGSGIGSKLELAKAAAINLLNSGSDVTFNQIMVVNFSSGATINHVGPGAGSSGPVWTDTADAISYISGLGSGGTTNYEAALNEVTSNWGTGPTPATQTLVYFISDGIPNPPEARIDPGPEQDAWELFLATAPIGGVPTGVNVAYAIGIDTVVNDTDLSPIAWAPGNPDLPPVIIEDAADLEILLQGSLPGNPSGNVLTNDGFGADGGHIQSITIGGVTFTFDGDSIEQSGTFDPDFSLLPSADNGKQIVVLTDIGGRIIFNFAANGLNQAGDWDYLAPSSGIDTDTSIETFTYVLVDGDGDGATATLKIKVEPSPVPGITGEGDQTVYEAGLPARGSEPEGSGEAVLPAANSDPSEATSGTFVITSPDALLQITITPDAPDGPAVVIPISQLLTSGVTPIVIQTVEGKLVINGFNALTGTVSYTYTLEDNQDHSGGPVTDVFSITATDVNNDTSTPPFTLTITIVDNVPTAVLDKDSVIEGQQATGNVITDAAPSDNVDADTGKDTQGADGAKVTAILSDNPGGSPLTAVPVGGVTINGQYGQLTINPDGSYSYQANLNINNASPVLDTFTYTLTDSDGDVSTTTLEITIGDGTNPSVVHGATIPVDEEGLGTVNATGSAFATNVETNTGTVSFQAGSDNITGVAFTSVAGITADVNGVLGADIVWTLVDPTHIKGTIGLVDAILIDLTPPSLPITAGNTGSATVTVTLTDNFPHPDGLSQNVINLTGITVVATDTDGDPTSATVAVNVTDDVPSLNNLQVVSFDEIRSPACPLTIR